MNLPESLDTITFRSAWQEWLAYRKERRLPNYKPTGERRTLSMLAEMGHDNAVASIGQSIAQNWQGLFEVKGRGGRVVNTKGAGEFSGAF
jgi:hypothetical protein